MEKKCDTHKALLSAYEIKVKRLTVLVSITLGVFLFTLCVLYWILSAAAGELVANIVGITCLCATYGLLPIYCLLSIPSIKKAKRKSAEFYKNLNCESVFTTFNAVIDGGDGARRIKKPVHIDRTGFHNDEIDVKWEDYDIKIINGEIFGAEIRRMDMISRSGKTTISIELKHKSFYLLKNFLQAEELQAEDLEIAVLKKDRVVNNKIKVGQIPKDAVKIRSHLTLRVLAIMFVAALLACVLVGLALIHIALAIIVAVIGFIFIAIFEDFLMSVFELPAGTVYLCGDRIIHKAFRKRAVIAKEDLQVLFDGGEIVLKSNVYRIRIYNTVRNCEIINSFLGLRGEDVIENTHLIVCNYLQEDISKEYCRIIQSIARGQIENHLGFDIETDKCRELCGKCLHNSEVKE